MASQSSEHSSNSLKLIIKSANQKYDDFIVDHFELDWNIKRLKQFLTESYPKNPEIDSIRLIYSGKLLHDHCTLKEVLRQNSEIKSHIIHLVHSTNNSNKNVNNNSRNISNDDNEVDMDNELTPNSSSISSTSSDSTSSSSDSSPAPSLDTSHTRPNNDFESNTSFSQIQNDLNNLFQQQQQQRQEQTNLTPKQKFNQIHDYFIRYYESAGVPVQTNSWYSCYVQQMALYNYMYSNYLQSLTETQNDIFLTSETASQLIIERMFPEPVYQPEAAPPPAPVPAPAPAPVPAPAPAQNRAPPRAAAANADGAVDDDWLSLLHNVVSFLVLFSIIYYYSSMERFLVIFSIVLILILYHNGWLSLQRRQIRNVPINRRDQQPGDQGVNETENVTEQQQPPAAPEPGLLRIMVTFIVTFFTSMIPERPRAAAN